MRMMEALLLLSDLAAVQVLGLLFRKLSHFFLISFKIKCDKRY